MADVDESAPLLSAAKINPCSPELNVYMEYLRFSVITLSSHAFLSVVQSYYIYHLGIYCGRIGLGLLYFTAAISSIFSAKPLILMLGVNRSIHFAHIGFTTYCATFTISILLPILKWPLIIFGSIICGPLLSIWWISCGLYYARASDLACSKFNLDIVNSSNLTSTKFKLSVIFASCLLLFSIIIKISASTIVHNYGLIYFFVPLVLVSALLTTFTMSAFQSKDFSREFIDYSSFSYGELVDSAMSTTNLLQSELNTWLLGAFAIAFHLIYALLYFFMSGNLITLDIYIGSNIINILVVIITLLSVAVVPMTYFISKADNKGLHAGIFAASVLLVKLSLFLIFSHSLALSTSSTFTLILLRAEIIAVKAIFYGSYFLVYSECFRLEDRGSAYAALTFFSSLSESMVFLLYPNVTLAQLGTFAGAVSLLSIACYRQATATNPKRPNLGPHIPQETNSAKYAPI